MLTPVFSVFKLSFLTSLIGTVESGGGGHLKTLCPRLPDEDFQTHIICMDFFFYGGQLTFDLAPSSWSSCIVFFMGYDPVLDYSKDSKAEH